MDYHELKTKNVAQLRELAATLEGLTGYTQMNKQHLLEAICKHLGIALHEHHAAAGIDKAAVKARIRALKEERQRALDARDRAKFRQTLREIHRLKRKLRSAVV